MKIGIILGTRPEIIKLSPIIFACEELDLDYFILHTNQHYTKEMDSIFFKELQIPQPEINLNIGSGSHGYQTGIMLQKIEKILLERRVEIILVQGDTNTVLAGSLAGCKIGVKIAHVEAGLRSYDRRMPEEINRVVADHVADYCFAPTETEGKILAREGIPSEKIYVTGNTIVDAVNRYSEKARNTIIEEFGIYQKEYLFLTTHRPSNVDFKEKLLELIKGLELVIKHTKLPVIFPVHPRTRNKLEEFNLYLPEGVRCIKPVSYLESIALQRDARCVITDSGGIQEEACILGVPCVTLRENTERPQTIEIGANILTGVNSDKILAGYQEMLEKKVEWENPYGDGRSGKRIIEILLNIFDL